MHRSIIAFLGAHLLSSCVTTHANEEVVRANGNLIVSCAPNPEIDAERFKLLSCTFENRSDSWLTVKARRLTLGDDVEARVSSPEDIADFSVAWAFETQ